jgi:very-short-patch-repair endonuclease
MSELEERVNLLIEEALPYYKVIRQYCVFYRNQQLRFDFYLPELKVLIEVQGQQHYTFNKFHYSSVDEFNRQKARDTLKEEYCYEKGYTFLALKYDRIKKLTADELKSLIISN